MKIQCPCCHQSDKTYKVSLLYVEATARINKHEMGEMAELDALLNDETVSASSHANQNQFLINLIRAFAPPSGSQQVTRTIHPDLMVFFFGCITVLLLVQIARSQPTTLPVAVILLIGSLLAYFLFRQQVIRRYENNQQQKQNEKEQVEQSVARWMRIYFCSRDQGVFDPETNQFASIEQMGHLLRDS